MKKFKLLLAGMACLCMFTKNVNAASISVSASSSSITTGSKVTFYVKITGASWTLTGNGIGATSGCSLGTDRVGDSGTGTIGTKTISATCTATSTGAIAFSVSGTVWDSTSSSKGVSGSKTVTVTAPRAKDTNNYLSALGIKGYSITPEFNKDTLEYSVDVPANVTSVTIEATAASTYASLTGTGDIDVNEGVNGLEVKVMSETGEERTYSVKVNVKDDNPIKVNIDDKEYTLVKNSKSLTAPETYTATSVKINDIDIPAYTSDVTGYVLVGLKDSEGNIYLAIYNADKNSYILYNENKSNQLILFIEPINTNIEGFVKSGVAINGEVYDCLIPSSNRYFSLLKRIAQLQDNESAGPSTTSIIYAMNIVTGKEDYYLYNSSDNTFTKYSSFTDKYTNDFTKMKYIIWGLSGVVLLLLIIMIIGSKVRKAKKRKALKEVEHKIEDEQEVDVKKIEHKEKEEIKNKDEKEQKPESKSKETATKKLDDATKMIDDFEKGNKKHEEHPKKDDAIEATMYDMFEDDKRKKKK